MKKYIFILAIAMSIFIANGYALALESGCCAKSACVCVKGGCCSKGKCECKGSCCTKDTCNCKSGNCDKNCDCKKS